MSIAERIGKWSLRHPVAVLTAVAVTAGVVGGAAVNGLGGGLISGGTALILSTLIASAERRAVSLGPHQ